jgi:hypothetical protein
VRRRFGRQCRGRGPLCVTVGRPTAPPGWARGHPVLPLARAAPQWSHGATPLSAAQRVRLDTPRTAALEAPQRIAPRSRRRTPGHAVAHGKRVNAYAPPMAPIGPGQSHGPAPFGRTSGMRAEPAAGLSVGLHRPVGQPRAPSSVPPWVDTGQQAMARVATAPRPALHARAGDLAFTAAALREGGPQQGSLTGGLPQPVEPLPPSPAPEDVMRLLHAGDVPRARPRCQGDLAYACGESRPVVDSLMASLRCRGAPRITDTGPRGAIVQAEMAIMAHHAATLVRLHEYRLSKRARQCRRRLRLRCRHVSQCHASIN